MKLFRQSCLLVEVVCRKRLQVVALFQLKSATLGSEIKCFKKACLLSY